MKNQRTNTDAHRDERLRTLEAALDVAIERAKAAKNVAKQAKDDAKHAKKERKRASKALIQAQEEYGLAPVGESDADARVDSSLGERIAESPERRRRVRTKKKAAKPKSTDDV